MALGINTEKGPNYSPSDTPVRGCRRKVAAALAPSGNGSGSSIWKSGTAGAVLGGSTARTKGGLKTTGTPRNSTNTGPRQSLGQSSMARRIPHQDLGSAAPIPVSSLPHSEWVAKEARDLHTDSYARRNHGGTLPAIGSRFSRRGGRLRRRRDRDRRSTSWDALTRACLFGEWMVARR